MTFYVLSKLVSLILRLFLELKKESASDFWRLYEYSLREVI